MGEAGVRVSDGTSLSLPLDHWHGLVDFLSESLRFSILRRWRLFSVRTTDILIFAVPLSFFDMHHPSET